MLNGVRASRLEAWLRGQVGRIAWRKWLGYARFAAIAFGFAWAIIYPLITPFEPNDLKIFIAAASGEDMTGFYYTPWILPFFRLLAPLPLPVAHIIANLASLLGFYFALRVFKGDKALLFTSYPLLIAIYYGQVEGIYAAGLAWMFVALRRDDPFQASLGWMIAIVKFYVGIPLGLGLLWFFAKDNRARMRVIGLVLLYGLLSLILWPNWPFDLLARSADVAPNTAYGIDLWSHTGPAILLLWIPVLLSRRKDYRWWVATWTLTVPYLWVWGLTQLLVLPLGWIGWLVQISYVTGFIVSTFLQVIPLYIYVISWRQSWRTDRLSAALRAFKRRRGQRAHEEPDTSRLAV